MKKVLYMIIFCTLIAIGGCGKKMDNEQINFQEIDCATKEELLQQGAFLFDVREKEEYDFYHLEEAINYSSKTILENIEEELIKDAPIIVYCNTGTRSKEVAKGLVKLGYTKVYDLGGIDSCVKEIKD